MEVWAQDSVNGNTVALTVTVIVTEIQNFLIATPTFSIVRCSAHAKTLNGVGMKFIFPKTYVLCTCKKQHFSSNGGIQHMTETRHQSLATAHIGHKIFI